jgi:hypothetical protein
MRIKEDAFEEGLWTFSKIFFGGFIIYMLGAGLCGYREMKNDKIMETYVVHEEQYAPSVAGDFWNSPQDSRYSFSVESGKKTIRVKRQGSSFTLEDVASSIKTGDRVNISFPKVDKYDSLHIVSPDDVRVVN